MEDRYQYRLSKRKKEEIAQNLIDIVNDISLITEETRIFLGDWVLTGPEEKRKAFYDVWDIVLQNYMPTTRPILFRSCKRLVDGKIESFTGRFKCAQKFSEDENGISVGLLIICNTEEDLRVDELRKPGEYKHTFYPLIEVLRKGGICKDHFKEDEYIMRVSSNMYSFRWKK